MSTKMKTAYRIFKRKDRANYYIENKATGDQQCLGTSDPTEAQRLLDAKNQERQTPSLNMQLGKTFIMHADPKMATRTWQEAIDEMSSHGQEVSQLRYAREFKSTAYSTRIAKTNVQIAF